MLHLDHLAVSCENLNDGRDWVEERLARSLQPGGKHTKLGTHNMLLGLEEGVYFELIAIDPDAPDPGQRRWFDLDDFSGAPRLTNWICQTNDIDAALAKAPIGMGVPMELTRGDLRWMMVAGEDGHLPFDAAFPAVISWGSSPHPSTRLPSSGLKLRQLTVRHPDAETLRANLGPILDDPRIKFEQGSTSLEAVFDGPDGEKVIS
ncbi:VOC family protein [Rhodalgimonas zhirmunskyi]|uniref:VOC family protein n=1 Tax=Rhodalgimonas zhirmunskyi TaxID=2964767 RepID=A0AAJ1UAW2_9RHOB|nr:VOC family protein [Rhodoalgimonas zhirmunskyi]MDQ2092882.1 VOC family protein [Rhodoalgimonas zhirmunskyi]